MYKVNLMLDLAYKQIPILNLKHYHQKDLYHNVFALHELLIFLHFFKIILIILLYIHFLSFLQKYYYH